MCPDFHGRKNTALLSHWAYGCPEGAGAWLMIPPMPPNRPFVASRGHLGKLCSFARGNRGTISFTPRTRYGCTDYSTGEFHFYPGQKRYKSENGLHTPRALGTGRRCRQSLHGPCHCSNGTGLSSRMMLALFAAAPTTRSPDRSVMLLSWRAALALARGADMLLGTACSYHTLALILAPLSDMRGVVPM